MKRTTKTMVMAAGAAAFALATGFALAHPGGNGPGGGMGPGATGMGPGYGMHHGGMGMGPGQGMGPGAMGMGMGQNCYGMGPQGQGMGPGAMGMGPRGQGMGPGQANCGDPAAALDSRLAAVKDELKITAEQDAAWQAYAAQAKSGVEGMRAFRSTMYASPPATATERLERHEAMLQQRLALSQERTKAVKALYEVLTPEQRALADQRLFAMGPGFGPGPGGRRR